MESILVVSTHWSFIIFQIIFALLDFIFIYFENMC